MCFMWGGRWKESVEGGENGQKTLYTYMKIGNWNYFKKVEEWGGGVIEGEFNWGMLNAYMQISNKSHLYN
jgi:hypothetical protein